MFWSAKQFAKISSVVYLFMTGSKKCKQTKAGQWDKDNYEVFGCSASLFNEFIVNRWQQSRFPPEKVKCPGSNITRWRFQSIIAMYSYRLHKNFDGRQRTFFYQINAWTLTAFLNLSLADLVLGDRPGEGGPSLLDGRGEPPARAVHGSRTRVQHQGGICIETPRKI